MPKITEIDERAFDVYPTPGLPWLEKALDKGFVKGGRYLIAGDPGIGKTTLGIQILGALGLQGLKGLYLTNEQSLGDLMRVVNRILTDEKGRLPAKITENVFLDDYVTDLEELPNFLQKRVLTPSAEYSGISALILDSIQGQGLSGTSTKKFKALYQFCDWAKDNGIITFLIGHVTKKSQIAGPKDLEHNVDCIIYIKKAFTLRPLFVPKNRYAPAVLEPIILLMEEKGLVESPHAKAETAVVLGYGGIGEDLSEAQTAVSLPKLGERPDLNAPFLPSKKIKQIIHTISTIKGIDVSDLSYEINCFIPAGRGYRIELDLPITISLIGSYLHQQIPNDMLLVGEIDLMKNVRKPDRGYLASLASLIVGGKINNVNTVVLNKEAVSMLKEMQPLKKGRKVKEFVEVIGVKDLEELLCILWPDLYESS